MNDKITGRTPSDAFIEAIHILGKLAPLTVIMAGSIFAIYKFWDLSNTQQEKINEAQNNAQQEYRLELDVANKALRDTYNQIGTLTTTQITNVKSLLELSNLQRQRLESLQIEVKSNMVGSIEEKLKYLTVKTNYEKVIKEKELLDLELSELSEKKKTYKEELASIQDSLKIQRTKLATRVGDIDELKTSLKNLANLVIEDSGIAKSSAETIISKYFIDFNQVLEGYIKNPELYKDENLKSLLGLSYEELISFSKTNNGFSYWLTVEGDDRFLDIDKKNKSIKIFAGLVEESAPYKRMIVFTLDQEQSTVIDVSIHPEIFAITMPTIEDWNKFRTGYVWGNETSATAHYNMSKSKQWTLRDVKNINKVLFGKIPDAESISLDKLYQQRPNSFESFSGLLDQEINMYLNSLSFNAGNIDGMDNDNIPKNLKIALTTILESSVERNLEKFTTHIDTSFDPIVMGKIAALSLISNIRIAVVDDKSPIEEGEKDKVLKILIIAPILDGWGRATEKTKSYYFTFYKNTITDKWLMSDFKLPIVQ